MDVHLFEIQVPIRMQSKKNIRIACLQTNNIGGNSSESLRLLRVLPQPGQSINLQPKHIYRKVVETPGPGVRVVNSLSHVNSSATGAASSFIRNSAELRFRISQFSVRLRPLGNLGAALSRTLRTRGQRRKTVMFTCKGPRNNLTGAL